MDSIKRKCRSFVFALALFGAAGPALAQNTSTPSYPPISPLEPRFGITHLSEDVIARLQATSVAGTVSQADPWDRVRALAPGTEILVSVNGLYQGRRSFVSADESALTVLMPADATLPRVVVRIARADVAEIRAAKVRYTGHTARRSFAAVGGAFAGYLVGGMAGGLIGAAVDCSIGGCGDLPAGLFVGLAVGGVTGGVGGGVLGYRAASDKTHDVIYVTPANGALAAVGSATSVAGQEPAVASVASTLTPGTRVRVLSTSVQARVRGVVLAVDDTVLTLVPEGGLPLKVPLLSITQMDVSLGQRRHTLKGLAIGALSGIALGFAFRVDAENCDPNKASNFCSRGDAIGGGTLLLGGLGTVIGALIKTDRWAPMISAGLRSPATTGGPALEVALALRF